MCPEASAVRPGVRLPKNVRPDEYYLTFTPNLKKFTFDGSELIEIEVLEETSEIVLHAVDLSIYNVKVIARDRFIPRLQGTEFNKEAETVTLKFDRVFQKGRYALTINFSGVLNDKMRGFYRSSYEVNGEKRWMACTQFEATDARRAFPCWDEPAIKATFRIAFIVPRHLQVLSNMPVQRCPDFWPFKVIQFEKTPPMSTYALAFAVGEFESIETRTKDLELEAESCEGECCGNGQKSKIVIPGKPIRVWTTPGKVEQGRFALDTCKKSIEFFEEYLGVPYPLPKLDLVAVPDFASGAMENWGLVTYRETTLLYDPENSAASAKQRVAEVVIHENTHMWFGDLVTMKWWNDLWLNEGFASFLEPKCTDYLFPEWDIQTQFVAGEYANALSKDGLKSTHPIEVEVNDPAEINEIFDAISYSKGACVIRMLVEYLGEEVFRKCLKAYLIRFAYKNASTDELYEVFEEVSGKSVKSFMDGWTKQAGYPSVSVRRIDGGFVSLGQERFLSSGETLDSEERGKRWTIPLGIELGGLGELRVTMPSSEADYQSLFSAGNTWLKINTGQMAFCRVHYEPEFLHKLRVPLSNGDLPPIDRFGVLSDLFYNARSGRVSAEELLSLLPYYRGERNYAVWQEILSILASLDNLLCSTDFSGGLVDFSRLLMKDISEHVGWKQKDNETHTDKLLRSRILRGFANLAKDPATVFEAYRQFKSGFISPDLKEAVYAIVADHGSDAEYHALLDLYRATGLSEEKTRILRALGKFRSQALIESVLEFMLSDEVRPQDVFFISGSVGANAYARDRAWEFLKNNFAELSRRYSDGGIFMFQSIIGGLINDFVSEGKAREIEEFFASHPVPSAKRTIEQSLEHIRMNARWLSRDAANIKKFFFGII